MNQNFNNGQSVADLGELKMAYKVHGTGAPVVLLHGGLVTGEVMWGQHVDKLSGSHKVYVPDLRGHGQTRNPSDVLEVDQMARDVADFIKAVGIEKPLIVGYSTGARIALKLESMFPGTSKGLVLGAVGFKRSEGYLYGIRAMGFPAPGDVDVDAFAKANGGFLDLIKMVHTPDGDQDYWQTVLRQTSAMWHGLADFTDADFTGVTVPSLVISGDRDFMTDLDETIRIYRGLKAGELAIIPNADHGAMEQPLFWQAVTEFLGRQA